SVHCVSDTDADHATRQFYEQRHLYIRGEFNRYIDGPGPVYSQSAGGDSGGRSEQCRRSEIDGGVEFSASLSTCTALRGRVCARQLARVDKADAQPWLALGFHWHTGRSQRTLCQYGGSADGRCFRWRLAVLHTAIAARERACGDSKPAGGQWHYADASEWQQPDPCAEDQLCAESWLCLSTYAKAGAARRCRHLLSRQRESWPEREQLCELSLPDHIELFCSECDDADHCR